MKKVLSVLLAAAMVMGMSVSALARPATTTTTDAQFGNAASNTNTANATSVIWESLMIVRDGVVTAAAVESLVDEEVTLEAGDELYFLVKGLGENGTSIPKGWTVKLSNADHVESAELMVINATTTGANNTINNHFWANIADFMHPSSVAYPCGECGYTGEHFHTAGSKPLGEREYLAYNAAGKIVGEKLLAVKVVLDADFDHYTASDDEFYFYIYDTNHNTKSQRVAVTYDYSNYAKKTLVEADLDWVITVDEPTAYTYKKGEDAAKATIDFDGLALGEFKMWAEEVYTLYASSKYNKTLSKAYDTDVEVITFTLGNAEGIDVVFPAAKDAYQVVAVVDGELVPVEATYVEDHKFASGKVTDGYFVENLEAGQYAVIDASIEVVEEEEEVVVETPVVEDTTKANPETGASDFVGAAVALAVVSVAAAGALALKK